MNTCNKIENGSCGRCTVPDILWRKIGPNNRAEIDTIAEEVSRQYCPDESEGIDAPTKAVVYNWNTVWITPKSIM